MKTTLKLAGAALAATLVSGAQPALASSHREAPLISEDPAADATDFYMFRTPQDDTGAVAGSNTVTFIANYWPMQEPGGGPNWVRFGDSVLYEIKIDNDGDAKEDITYQFRFNTTFKAGTSSFLFAKPGGTTAASNAVTSPTDDKLQVVQNYTVDKVDKQGVVTHLVTDGIVPPPYIGDYTTPNYTTIANAAIKTFGTNSKVFAGQRDDPFFADLGAIFDLVRIRCSTLGGGGVTSPGGNLPGGCAAQAGTASMVNGVDFLAGYNVHSIVLQVPIAQVTVDGTVPTTSAKNAVIGAWTTASRQRVTIRRSPSLGGAGTVKTSDSYGQWVQVSRLGLPLINEVIVPVGLKDYYNSTPPSNDLKVFTAVPSLLGDPELAKGLIALYGAANIIPVATAPNRTDLVNLVAFQVGPTNASVGPFKGMTAGYGLTPADILRVDLSYPAPASSAVNRLGALAPAGMGAEANVGFPNGRRLGDDVVDILERVVAGGVLAGTTGGLNGALTDVVNANDVAFTATFPYVAAPWSGSKVGSTPTATTNLNLLHQYR